MIITIIEPSLALLGFGLNHIIDFEDHFYDLSCQLELSLL